MNFCQAQPKLQVKLSLKAELALFSFDPAHSLRNQTHSLRNQPRESTHSLRNQPCESLFSFLIAPNLNPTEKVYLSPKLHLILIQNAG